MVSRRFCFLVMVACWSAVIGAQQPVFRTGARTVSLYATATDADRRPISDLTRDDFVIFDNDKPQETTVFANDVQPIGLVVMLDTSASMTGNMKLVEEAAEQFLLRLLPHDKALVGSFNDKIEFVPKAFTHDRDKLVASLRELDFGNPTKLYDAIAASIERLLEVDGRRVVLVFTDGDDTGSAVDEGAVLSLAQNNDVMVYAVGLRSTYYVGGRRIKTKPGSGLKMLAAETGGGYFELDATTDLSPTFTKIARELHTQYALGFTPPVLDGRLHRVTVRVNRPGASVRARRNYLASTDSN